MIKTPNNLEILLHYYVSSSPHPRISAKAVLEGINYLLTEQMLHISENGNTYEVSAKGIYYIQYILLVPFPEAKWVIPKEGCSQ